MDLCQPGGTVVDLQEHLQASAETHRDERRLQDPLEHLQDPKMVHRGKIQAEPRQLLLLFLDFFVTFHRQLCQQLKNNLGIINCEPPFTHFITKTTR
jgi:hypothetical protein